MTSVKLVLVPSLNLKLLVAITTTEAAKSKRVRILNTRAEFTTALEAISHA